MRMEMSMRLSQKLELSHKLQQELIASLTQKLEQRVGHLEKQVLDKVVYIDVDFEDPNKEYHVQMLGELLVKKTEDDPSLLTQTLAKVEMTEAEIESILVESFEMSDVSLDIGTKRDVDLVSVVFKDGRSIQMTISLDKDTFDRPDDSPSYQEAKTLRDVDSETTWCVQKFLGSRQTGELEDDEGFKFVICKEFLPGEMLANITTDIDYNTIDGKYDDDPEATERIKQVSQEVGKMIANALTSLKGIPSDSNPLNIIINTDNTEHQARYCDSEKLITDKANIKREIDLLATEFGPFKEDFLQAIADNYQGPLWSHH